MNHPFVRDQAFTRPPPLTNYVDGGVVHYTPSTEAWLSHIHKKNGGYIRKVLHGIKSKKL